MNWTNFTNWTKGQFAAVFSWLKREAANLDSINDSLRRIERDQQLFFTQLFAKVDNMSQQTDALTTEVDKVVAVLQSGDALLKASAEAQGQLQSHLAGDTLDAAAVQAATDKLASARAAFEADVAKLTPAATGTATGA